LKIAVNRKINDNNNLRPFKVLVVFFWFSKSQLDKIGLSFRKQILPQRTQRLNTKNTKFAATHSL